MPRSLLALPVRLARTQVRRMTPVPVSLSLLVLMGAGTGWAGGASNFRVADRRPEVSQRTLTALAATPSAATQKVWIGFTDKNIFDQTSYETRLREVAGELDDHAVARRAKVMKSGLVDFLDIPVPAGYLDELERMGVEVVHESRWLNAVSARASLEVWTQVAALPFVRQLTFVRGGSPARPTDSARTNPNGQERGGLDYGPSFDQLDEINVVAVHGLGITGAGVRVAMLDTGYYQDHAAFQVPIANGQILDQWDFINGDGETQDEPGDPVGQHYHGTITWSIVGGFDESELVGAAYGAGFLLAKTEDISMEDPIEEDNWIAGMEWADAGGADVISSSLGYKDWYDYEDLDGNTAVTTIGADIAVGRGIVVCTAMGNEGTQDWYFLIAPADADSTISVGGSFPDGSIWDQSSHGPTADGRTKPEVVARGSSTRGAASPEDHNGEGYRDFDGTSVATPLVAGAAALLLEAHPSWTPMMVREALMMTADNAQTPDNDRGWGRIDVLAALSYGPTDAPETVSTGTIQLTASPNPFVETTTISWRAPGATGPGVLELFSPEGRRVRVTDVRFPDEPIVLRAQGEGETPLSAGVYLLRLTLGDSGVTTKLILGR